MLWFSLKLDRYGSRRRCGAWLLALALLPAGAAWAQVSAGWKTNADGNWSVAANWTVGGAATGTTGVASFTNAITGARTVTVDRSPWTIKSLTFTNNSAGNAYGWTIIGGTLNLAASSTFTVNGAASTATVASALTGVDIYKAGNGTLILSGNSSVGVGAMTGGGTLVLNGATMTNAATSQAAYQSFGNTIVVSNNAVWNLGGQMVNFGDGGGSGTAGSNQLIISGAVMTNVGTAFHLGYHNNTGSSVVITNGGKLYSQGIAYVGQAASFANWLLVTGDDSLWNNGGQSISISDAVGSTNNWMTIADHGVVTNVNIMYVAAGNTASCQGSLTVSGGGKLYITNELQLGNATSSGLMDITDGGSVYVTSTSRVGNASSSNCSLTVRNGGLLDASAIVMGKSATAGTGDVLTVSSGGILQFSTKAPSITINNAAGGNGVVISNGTLSFRGIQSGALPNLTNNWAKTGGIGTNTISWQGANTLRLDGSLASNTLAYTLGDPAKGATNYAGLELLNATNGLLGAGSLTIGAAGSLLVSNSTLTVFAGALTNNSANVNLANVASLVASNGIVWGSGSAATTTLGQVTFAAVTTNTLNSGTVTWVQLAGATQTVAGVIQGSGGLAKAGGGTLVLTATNSFSGATTPRAGLLLLGNGLALANSVLTLATGDTGAALYTNGVTAATLGGLSGTRAYTLTNAAGVGLALTLAPGSGTSASYSGVLADAGLGVALVKTGAGTQTLSGANTYSGGTAVSNGVLKVNNVSGSGVGSGAVTVYSGGTLGGTGRISGAVSVQTGGALAPGNSVGTLTVGSLTLSTNSLLSYEFNPTGNDLTVVTNLNGLSIGGGLLSLYKESDGTKYDALGVYRLFQYNGALDGSAGYLGIAAATRTSNRSYSFGANGGYVTLTIGAQGLGWTGGDTNAGTGDGFWTHAFNWATTNAPEAGDLLIFDGNYRTSTTNDFAAHTAFAGFLFTNSAGAFTLNGSNVNLQGDIVNLSPATQTVNLDLTLDYGPPKRLDATGGAIVLNGAIGETNGPLALLKTGTNTVTLTASNTYSGTTTITQGALRVTSAWALGSAAAGTEVTAGGALELSGGITVAGEALTLAGAGVGSGGALRSVSGSNTYTGAISFTDATRLAADSGATLALPNALDNAGYTLTFGGAGNVLVNGAITNTGGLVKDGGGTLTLSAANTYSGGTTVSNGLLALSGGADRLSTAGALTLAGGTLDLGGYRPTTTEAVTFSGGTLCNGTLTNDGAAFDGRSGTVAADLAGAVGLEKTTTGTLTLAGTNTYTGTTTVGEGALQVNGLIGAGDGLEVRVTGGTLSGSGTILRDVTVTTGGTLAPGVASDPGTGGVVTMSVSNLTMEASSSFTVSLFSANSYDQLVAQGFTDLTNVTFTARSLLAADTPTGSVFTVFQATNALENIFYAAGELLTEGAFYTNNGAVFAVNYRQQPEAATYTMDLTLLENAPSPITAIPEPLFLGIVGMLLLLRRWLRGGAVRVAGGCAP